LQAAFSVADNLLGDNCNDLLASHLVQSKDMGNTLF
jgi:hypothetical protein